MWTKSSNAAPLPRGIVQPNASSPSQQQAQLKSCKSGLQSSRTVSSGEWRGDGIELERNDVHILDELYDIVAMRLHQHPR